MGIRRVALGAFFLILAGCRGQAPIPAFGRASLVLISIDTLRADHLPAYGFARGRTPNLDRLAREGVLFEDLYSHCPLTLPAHSSLFTGLLPPHHGVRDNIGFTLRTDHPTLASRLKEAGFVTGGAVSAYVLRSQTGIARGFDYYDDALELAASEDLGMLQRNGAVAVESLSGWIAKQQGKRFFAFLHLYEPHTPYTPPEGFQDLPSPYDGEIAYADTLVGRLLEAIRPRLDDPGVVVAVTSDHGEGLKDHGEAEHGMFLYREDLHVPLVIRLPGQPRAGRRIRGVVAQADIAPTLLDLLGIAGAGMDGVSLRGSIATERLETRPVYSETLYPRYHFGWSELYAVSDIRYRFIRAPRPELFDLGRDPGEKQNVSSEHPDAVRSMGAWLLTQVDPSRIQEAEKVSEDTRERLQALGYLGLGGVEPENGLRPDPKDKIASYEDLRQAYGLKHEGKVAEAGALLEKVLATNPKMLDALMAYSSVLLELGRKSDAGAALVRALAVDPERPETNIALARFSALQGQLNKAVQHAQIASRKDPGLGFETLAQIMLDRNRTEDAVTFAHKSLAEDPDRIMSLYVLGVVAQRAGRCEDAVRSLRRAEEMNSRREKSVVLELHYDLGDCLARLGRNAEAEVEFVAEIRTFPWTRKGRVGLATLYWSEGRDQEARDVLAQIISRDPRPVPETYFTVIRTLRVLGDGEGAALWAGRARQLFPGDRRF